MNLLFLSARAQIPRNERMYKLGSTQQDKSESRRGNLLSASFPETNLGALEMTSIVNAHHER